MLYSCTKRHNTSIITFFFYFFSILSFIWSNFLLICIEKSQKNLHVSDSRSLSGCIIPCLAKENTTPQKHTFSDFVKSLMLQPFILRLRYNYILTDNICYGFTKFPTYSSRWWVLSFVYILPDAIGTDNLILSGYYIASKLLLTQFHVSFSLFFSFALCKLSTSIFLF